MASMAQYACKNCGGSFTARTADRARGWAQFCSKTCKAVKQVKNGGPSGPGQGAGTGKKYPRHDGISPMKHKTCDTCGAPAINGVYGIGGEIEWGCALHHDTSHPFSSDALGQW